MGDFDATAARDHIALLSAFADTTPDEERLMELLGETLDALDERNNSWHRLWANTTALWHRLLAAEKASEKSMARVKELENEKRDLFVKRVTDARRIEELEAERAEWDHVLCPTCNGIRKPCDACWGWRWIYRHKPWDETRVLREGQDG